MRVIVGLAVSFALTEFSWRVVESPAMRLKSQRRVLAPQSEPPKMPRRRDATLAGI
jgi:peptidoglycan/LPS O-acetylase OafA/YrhL